MNEQRSNGMQAAREERKEGRNYGNKELARINEEEQGKEDGREIVKEEQRIIEG